MSEKKTVIYKGIQYDITHFLQQHPGGTHIILNYIASNPNITEVFKSIHPPSAEQRLLALPQLAKAQRTKHQKTYLKIQERVSKLYQPSIPLEIFFISVILTLYISSLWVSHPLIAILTHSSSQILTAWVSHSQLHTHSRRLRQVAKMFGGVVMGLSVHWWEKKHQSHHIFTNSQQLDPDIDHNYRTIMYPLLLFKWRIESIWAIIRHLQFVEAFYVALGYYLLLRQKIPCLAVGSLIASLFIVVVVFGNHERELKFRANHLDPFLSHQLATTTDYEFTSTISLLMLGGFQYHTEHHLFPQVPFYRLEEARRITLEELPGGGKDVKISTIV